MRLVNWSEYILNGRVKLLFSALAFPPHKDTIDANLVAFELPDDLYVDVEWVRKLGKYVVTLFHEDIDNKIREASCQSVYEVIEAVQRFIDHGLCEMSVAADTEPSDCMPAADWKDSYCEPVEVHYGTAAAA